MYSKKSIKKKTIFVWTVYNALAVKNIDKSKKGVLKNWC